MNMAKHNMFFDLIKAYWWALFIIVIFVYAIYAFVVLDEEYVEKDCKLSSGFVCNNPSASSFSKTLSFDITNNKKYPLEIIGVDSLICSGVSALGLGVGETKRIEITPCSLNEGQRYDESLLITYRNLLNNKNETIVVNIIVRAVK